MDQPEDQIRKDIIRADANLVAELVVLKALAYSLGNLCKSRSRFEKEVCLPFLELAKIFN